MVAAIEAVASEMRDRGLTVHVKIAGGPASGPEIPDGADAAGLPDGAGHVVNAGSAAEPDGLASAGLAAGPARVPAVPVPVAVAIAYAVREALANVASHAETGEAWVEICPKAPDGGGAVPAGAVPAGGVPAGGVPAGAVPAGNALTAGEPETCPDGIRVIVRDAGAGFDPGKVDPSRLGLRRSIVERLADWGGRALIRSSPGAGTEVILCWAPPPDAGQATVPGGSAALAGV
jgi:hypothetical protein